MFRIMCFFILIFFSGCATVDRGNLGVMKRSLNNTYHGYQIVKDHTKQAPTEYIEKFEVRPGDCAADSYGGWSDCANDRERSELTEQTKSTYSGSEYWYGWSMYVPENYPNIYPTKVALGQFHQIGSHPAWMFQNHDGGLYLDKQIIGGKVRDYIEVINKDDFKGQWHRIEIHVKWTRGDDGFFKVWTNGKQKVDYKGMTMTASKIYFKYGVYRSFLSRYKRHAQSTWVSQIPEGEEVPDYQDMPRMEVPTQIVYFSNVKRSNTREGLSP